MSGAWAEHRWWWLPVLVLVVVNLLASAWYGLVYSGYARRIDQQLESRQRALERLESVVAAEREAAGRLRRNQEELSGFYATRLAPPSERLTDVIREVRTLAQTAGLQPASIDYPEDDLADYGLVKRSFSFGVRGSYAQLRQFLNLLEMTDSFLTLEEVQLTGRGNQPELRISLRLSTLFVDDDSPVGAEEAAT